MSKNPVTNRSYAKGRFWLTLDMAGSTGAWIESVSGGNVRCEASETPDSASTFTSKTLESLIVEPLVFKQAVGASWPLLHWIQQSWKRKPARYSGMILHANFKHQVQFEHEFRDALIQEIQFPALDAKSTDSGYLTIKVQPERVKMQRVPKAQRPAHAPEDIRVKNWLLCNFRLSLFNQGTSIDTNGVRKIDGFTVTQTLKSHMTGNPNGRFPDYQPTGIKFPDLKLTVSMAYIDGFLQWHKTFVLDGRHAPTDHYTGYIEYLDSTTAKVLMTINLDGVGIKTVIFDENNKQEDIHTATVELYVDSMELKMG